MADTFFCLDIGDTYIKSVDCIYSNGKYNLLSIGLTENNQQFYNSDSEKIIDDVTTRIKKLTETSTVQKKNVHCIIPDSYTFSQIVEMPNLNERELISAIRYQADQFIPMPIDETNIDIEILQENPQTNKVLVLMVAAPKKIVDKVQSSIELSGLIPVSLESSLSATARFFLNSGKSIVSQNDNVLLVNIELNSTSIYAFDTKKGTILKNHTFPIGYQLFIKELQINTNLDYQKATEILQSYSGSQESSLPINKIIAPLLKEYSNEINKFILSNYSRNNTTVKKIFFINDSLRIASLPKLLEGTLSIPGQYFDPLPLFMNNKIVEAYKKSLSLFVSAIGGNSR